MECLNPPPSPCTPLRFHKDDKKRDQSRVDLTVRLKSAGGRERRERSSPPRPSLVDLKSHDLKDLYAAPPTLHLLTRERTRISHSAGLFLETFFFCLHFLQRGGHLPGRSYTSCDFFLLLFFFSPPRAL